MGNTIELSANGKLLITGEYLVMAGAKSLALPLRFGQKMKVVPRTDRNIVWKSNAGGQCWFNAAIDQEDLQVKSPDSFETAQKLSGILRRVRELNPGFLTGPTGYDIFVNADYPLEWGLGSSSTLLSLISRWGDVDVLELSRPFYNGSGYDLTCATRSDLLKYSLRDGIQRIEPACPGKALRTFSYFAYSGRKADSAGEVARFRLLPGNFSKQSDLISELTDRVLNAVDHTELETLVREHESIMAGVLNRRPVAEMFPGIPGAVKSLGAWGGDFMMFVTGESFYDLARILSRFGISHVFTYDQIRVRP